MLWSLFIHIYQRNNQRKTFHLIVIINISVVYIVTTLQCLVKWFGLTVHYFRDLKSLTLEQDTLGGTVFTFPRKKIVMTSPMDLPLHGKVKLFETNKTELLNLWNSVLNKHEIEIKENSKVESISLVNNAYKVVTLSGEEYVTKHVLLAIGRSDGKGIQAFRQTKNN